MSGTGCGTAVVDEAVVEAGAEAEAEAKANVEAEEAEEAVAVPSGGRAAVR